uniref:Uncharacterized protein n=1 Tax=Zea mays TaxID=4577 RepID=A0A804LQR2_MAIZE
MFDFVTFVYAETVKAILSKGNPHFVCDARSSSPTRRRVRSPAGSGSCSTRTMAEPSSLVARRPPDCWIPGTPTPSCFFQVPRFSPEHEAIGL